MAQGIRKEDWECFRASGHAPRGIRKDVLGSWLRSRDLAEAGGAGLEALHSAPTLAPEDLARLRARNLRLRSVAGRALRRTGHFLGDAGVMLLLCDSRGVVLEAAGDARILARGAENHLQPGGHWGEAAIGTNAIGTALHLGRPVSIAGAEHFCEAIQRWSCSAAPVRDPVTGQMLGVIDLSAPSDLDMRRSAALSVSLAMQIEEGLRGLALREREALMSHLLASGRRREGDLVLFDRHGRKVWASDGASALADLPDPAGPDGADLQRMAAHLSAALPGAGVELIPERGEALGLAVFLPGKARRPAGEAAAGPVPDPAAGQRRTAEPSLREQERAGILAMLAQCGGNRTEAARRLGIARSTLYLKLAQYGAPQSPRPKIGHPAGG